MRSSGSAGLQALRRFVGTPDFSLSTAREFQCFPRAKQELRHGEKDATGGGREALWNLKGLRFFRILKFPNIVKSLYIVPEDDGKDW